MEEKLKIGTHVLCKGYVRKAGNSFEYLKESETDDGKPSCRAWNSRTREYSEELDDFLVVDRFEKVGTWFAGIYVGTTTLCTKIVASSEYDCFSGDFVRFQKEKPEKFAVVYYANNKKRLVPISDIETFEEATNER